MTDFESTPEKVAPIDAAYRHDAADIGTATLTMHARVNGHAHRRSLPLGVSAGINIVDGRLLLGRWR
jgi:thiamine phosphate synthase YjbQ (UPF0047 family)